jgi:hypothetical protein
MTTPGYLLSCEEFHPRKPTQAGFKVCHSRATDDCVRVAHTLRRTEELPGQLNQTLPAPAHFEQASSLVPASMVEQSVPCGPDAKPYIDRIRQFADAGFDEVYVQQIGSEQDGFFDFWESEIDAVQPGNVPPEWCPGEVRAQPINQRRWLGPVRLNTARQSGRGWAYLD